MSRRPAAAAAMDDDDAALAALEREAAADWAKASSGSGAGGGDQGMDELDAAMEAEMAREEAHLKKLFSDPSYAARLAAEAMAFDGSGGAGASETNIQDDDIMGELAELEGEVHAEGAGSGGSRSRGHSGAERHQAHADASMEFDEDAALRDAEAEADRIAAAEEAAARKPAPAARPASPPHPPRTQQQQVTSSTASAAPPAAVPAGPALGDLPTLQAQLLDFKRKAVELKNSGKQTEAFEMLRNCRTLQGRIAELQAKPSSAAAATATTAANARAAPPQPPAKPAALSAAAKQPTSAAKPTPPSRPSHSAVAAAAAAPATAITAAPSAARPVPPAVSSSGKLSLRANLEYDDLLQKLNDQISTLSASMASVARGDGAGASTNGAGSKNSKLLALQYFRAKTRSTKDRDLILLARQRNLPPPSTHWEDVEIQRELSFPQLGEDEVAIEVVGARELRNANVVSSPADLSTFVTCVLEYATDLDSGGVARTSPLSTPVAKSKGPAPSFNFKATIAFPFPRAPSTRDRTALKKLLRSKLVFTVWHKRFLLSALEVGRADVKLKEFSLKSELRLTLKLKDGPPGGGLGAQARTGELDVVVRLRRPFEGIDLRTEKIQLLIVDEFQEAGAETEAPSAAVAIEPPAAAASHVAPTAAAPVRPASASSTAGPSSSAAAASHSSAAAASSAAAPAATPAASPSIDLSDPHEILKMQSNDVLEAEILLLQGQLAALGPAQAQSDEADSLRDRIQAAQVQLQVLVTQVQHGKLTLADYLSGLKRSIASESALAMALGKAGRKTDALRVMQRIKIMKAEVQAAEENQEELEQC